jgi:hypothetical protein
VGYIGELCIRLSDGFFMGLFAVGEVLFLEVGKGGGEGLEFVGAGGVEDGAQESHLEAAFEGVLRVAIFDTVGDFALGCSRDSRARRALGVNTELTGGTGRTEFLESFGVAAFSDGPPAEAGTPNEGVCVYIVVRCMWG